MKKDSLIIVLGMLLVSFLILDAFIDAPLNRTAEPVQSFPTVQNAVGMSDPAATEAAAFSHTEANRATEPAASIRQPAGSASAPAAQLPAVSVTEPSNPTVPETLSGGEENYFDDVLFIGDSLTVGLRDNARLGNADYFCVVGMGVFSLSNATASDRSFSEQSLLSLLSSRSYGKIYFSLGINDAGYSLGAFRGQYAQWLETIRALQPDATVIVSCLLPVGREQSASADHYSLSHLARMNEAIASFADNETVFCLDPGTVLADEDGYLPNAYSGDGLHLYPQYYELWAKFIRDNPAAVS